MPTKWRLWQYWLTIVGVCMMLPGCMTTAYLAGSAANAFQNTFEQNAVLQIDLVIKNKPYRLNAPIGCRSFIHPIGGMRVTRNTGELFEFHIQEAEYAYFRISYGCAEDNAEIYFDSNALIQLYRVERSPVIRIVQDWAIPHSHAEASKAAVLLVSSRVVPPNTSINVKRIETIRKSLISSGVIAVDDVLLSINSPTIALDGPYIDPTDIDYLSSLTTVQPIPNAVAGRIVEKLRLSGKQASGVIPLTKDLASFLEEISFDFDQPSSAFIPGLATKGQRVYFPLPRDTCASDNETCRLVRARVKFGTTMLPATSFPIVIDPATRSIYLRQERKL
jgi:hypothetical protein